MILTTSVLFPWLKHLKWYKDTATAERVCVCVCVCVYFIRVLYVEEGELYNRL